MVIGEAMFTYRRQASASTMLVIFFSFVFLIGLATLTNPTAAKAEVIGTWQGDTINAAEDGTTSLAKEMDVYGGRRLLESYWKMDKSGRLFLETYSTYYFSTKYWLIRTDVIGKKTNAEVHFGDGTVERGSCTWYRNIWGTD